MTADVFLTPEGCREYACLIEERKAGRPWHPRDRATFRLLLRLAHQLERPCPS